MKKLSYSIAFLFIYLITISQVWSQKDPLLSLRLHFQPQVSSMQPYDSEFISSENKVSPSIAFGVEAIRNISDKLELSFGYHYSSQAGNFSLVECDVAYIGLGNFVAGRRRCPTPRGKIRVAKFPLALGWRFFENDKFMSKISAGPQIQLLINPPRWGLYTYKKLSAALMFEISSYYKLSKHLSFVAGLRTDRSMTAMDHNTADRSIGNSLGIVIGLEYTHWAADE